MSNRKDGTVDEPVEYEPINIQYIITNIQRYLTQKIAKDTVLPGM